MTILVIGSGSYVFDDPYGPGVVLRSVLQWLAQSGSLDADLSPQIKISYNRPETLHDKQAKLADIALKMKLPSVQGLVEFIPTEQVAEVVASGDLSACFIAVPDALHHHYAGMCMENHVPVWIVKPLTGNLADAEQLQALQQKTGTPVWVDYHKRFDASNAQLKIKTERSELGRMLAYSVDYHQPRTLPMDVFDWTADVDVFTYIGCHYVDQIFFLFPEASLQSVSAAPLKGMVYEATGQFDGVIATLVFETNQGQLVCPMNIGWFNPTGSPTKSLQKLKVQFERGVIDLDQTRRGINIWHDAGVSEVNPYFFGKTLNLDGASCYSGYGYESVSQFLELVSGGADWQTSQIAPTLTQAIKTEYVLAAVQKVLKSG